LNGFWQRRFWLGLLAGSDIVRRLLGNVQSRGLLFDFRLQDGQLWNIG